MDFPVLGNATTAVKKTSSTITTQPLSNNNIIATYKAANTHDLTTKITSEETESAQHVNTTQIEAQQPGQEPQNEQTTITPSTLTTMENKNINVTVSMASDSSRSTPPTFCTPKCFVSISVEPDSASISISAPPTEDEWYYEWEIEDEEEYKRLDSPEIWSEVTTKKATKLSTSEKEMTDPRGGAEVSLSL